MTIIDVLSNSRAQLVPYDGAVPWFLETLENISDRNLWFPISLILLELYLVEM